MTALISKQTTQHPWNMYENKQIANVVKLPVYSFLKQFPDENEKNDLQLKKKKKINMFQTM